jgi:holo-[acyl-carrier protein] synthase
MDTPVDVRVGIDLVEIRRIAALLERYEKAAERLFTDAEIEYCRRRRRPERHLAARFAAKEAVIKALGVVWGDRVGWRDIEIIVSPSGQPRARLTGAAATVARHAGLIDMDVSLAHTSELAIAKVLTRSAGAHA